MNKNELKKLVKWTAPLLGVEVLMFLIFYQVFAYLFVIFGIMFTFLLTFAIIYVIMSRIGEIKNE